MKILVYTLGVQGLVSEKASAAIQAKEADLKAKYPGIAVMVIPGPYVDGDKVEMIDMTPSAYPPLGVLGPAPTFPPTTYPLNPYGGIGTSVPFQTTGVGVPMADNNGAWWPGVTSTYTIGDKGPQGVTVDKPYSQPVGTYWPDTQSNFTPINITGNMPDIYTNPHDAAIKEATAPSWHWHSGQPKTVVSDVVVDNVVNFPPK